MEAGSELDALVATKVMGLVPCNKWTPGSIGSAGGFCMFSHHDICGHEMGKCFPSVPDLDWIGNGPQPYSTNIASAWLVVDRLRSFYSNVNLHGANGWGLSLGIITLDGEDWTAPIPADTAPLAICLAALEVLGND